MEIDPDYSYSSVTGSIPVFSGNGNVYTHEMIDGNVVHTLIGTGESGTPFDMTYLDIKIDANFTKERFLSYRGPVVRLFN